VGDDARQIRLASSGCNVTNGTRLAGCLQADFHRGLSLKITVQQVCTGIQAVRSIRVHEDLMLQAPFSDVSENDSNEILTQVIG
jgi:hypothetical protein